MANTFARMRQIAGTTAEWAANNIVLREGEIGVERIGASDVRMKVGNGVSTWSQLPYASNTVAAVDAQVATASVHAQTATTKANNATAEANRAKTEADRAESIVTPIIDDIPNITTVATNIGSVNTNASNIGSINNLSAAITNGDLLNNVYQGAASVDPTTRLGGAALQNGDIYWNTSTNRTRTYANGVWYDATPGGNTNADLVAYMPARTAAVATTVQAKLRQTVNVFDFMTSAQIASVQARDGLVAVSGAIQAAINAVKPTSETHPEKGTSVYFPEGLYRIDTTINVYSGVWLLGEGVGTVMYAGPSLTGAVFYLTQTGTNGYCVHVVIRDMKIQTVPDIYTTVINNIWAIKADPAVVIGSCIFAELLLWVRYGFKLDGYTQSTLIHTVMSVGQVDQILNLQGNYNRIVSLAKEGGGGEGLALNLSVPNPPGSGSATSEPYVFIGGPSYSDANLNIFEHLLIEGAGSPNKCAVKLQNAGGIEFKAFWQELSIVNGYNIEMDNSSLIIGQVANGPANAELTQLGYSNGGKYKLRNGSQLYIESFSNTYGYDKWQDFFDYDNTSFVSIGTIYTQLGLDQYRISKSSNLYFKSYVDQHVLVNNTPGRSALSMPHYRSGQNLFINPSFEAGTYGWNVNSGGPVTTTIEPSEVAQGNMVKFVTTGLSLDQATPITAAQVGQPLTITYVVKLEGAGWVFPVLANDGGGVMANRVYAGTGWQTVTFTYRPQSSGAFNSGLSMAGGGGASCTLYVDEMSICFGDEGVINTSKFGSFELNQRTFTAATAAPTSGTWKAGDRVFNSAPAVGQPKGWVCTVAGTPGTWVSEGNL